MSVYDEAIKVLEQVYDYYMERDYEYTSRGISEPYYMGEAIKIRSIINRLRKGSK